jgi:transposase
MVDQELKRLSPHFDQMYSHTGRPSIPPERVMKSLLLVALDSVRGERHLCEQLEDNLLFRIFIFHFAALPE